MRGHYHQDEQGIWRRCYHKCRHALTSWQFWFSVTVANTLEWIPEHVIWEKVPGFNNLAHWLGL